jgi:hypothetical protein
MLNTSTIAAQVAGNKEKGNPVPGGTTRPLSSTGIYIR